MDRENRNNKQDIAEVGKRKWMSILGFLASIALLTIAIFLSINEENKGRLANLESIKSNQNLVQMASSELSKNVNEVKKANSENTIDNKVNSNNTNEVNILLTAANTNTSTDNETVNDEGENEEKENDNDNENEKKDNKTKEQFIKPVNGEIIKSYSMDSLVYSDTLQEWVTHKGIDIKVNKGEEIKASSKGTISAIKNDPRYGVSVIIQHDNGFETVYSCLLNADCINEGDNVEQGQTIGVAGNSGVFEVADGAHLHFEILKDGEYVNPELYVK